MPASGSPNGKKWGRAARPLGKADEENVSSTISLVDAKRSRPSPATDLSALFNRAELLLAEAEIAVASGDDGGRQGTLHEALGRLHEGTATLHSGLATSVLAGLEEVRAERARLATESAALRRELELLRAERDLYLALSLEASEAAARRTVQAQQMHEAPGGCPEPERVMPFNGEEGSPRPSLPRHTDLASAEIREGAGTAAGRLLLMVIGIPGLRQVGDLERELAALPDVCRSDVQSLRKGAAEIVVAFAAPKAPLAFAAEINSSHHGRLTITGVSAGRLEARLSTSHP